MNIVKLKIKCSVPICIRNAEWKGLCPAHYARKYEHGDVRADIPLKEYPSIRERIEKLSMPVTESGCLIWIGGVNFSGYGLIILSENGKKKTKLAHRLVWELENGPIPNNGFICHKCDVPGCININHLFLGDAKINVNDMIKKGRRNLPLGTRQPAAKLNDEKIKEILLSSDSHGKLAVKYGVARGTIQKIKERRRWKHISI